MTPPAPTRTDDAAAFAAALEFERAIKRGACPIVRRTPLGEAFGAPDLPVVWSLNELHVDDAAGADLSTDVLVAALDDLYGELSHRRACLDSDTAGRRIADELAERATEGTDP